MKAYPKPATARVAEVNAKAVDRYKEMREALMSAQDIDRNLCEIVITTQLALLGYERPFKIHATRLFALNISKELVQQAILAGVGVTFVMAEAARALDWLDEAHEEFVTPAPG
jgi:hypothetical protein